MVERSSIPQIPTNVWWGFRSQLKKTPTATISTNFLAVQLKVQSTAARQYTNELRRVGLIGDDNKPTDLALRWRNDSTYKDAAAEILRANYDEGLLDLAPPGSANRQVVIDWFLKTGLGQGSANNKAATYLMLATLEPPSDDSTKSRSSASNTRTQRRAPEPQISNDQADSKSNNSRLIATPVEIKKANDENTIMPLNVNVQIHISADASTDQIVSIFAAMRKYLYDRDDI